MPRRESVRPCRPREVPWSLEDHAPAEESVRQLGVCGALELLPVCRAGDDHGVPAISWEMSWAQYRQEGQAWMQKPGSH